MVKAFGNTVSRLAAMAVLATTLSAPLMVSDAMAQTCNVRTRCPDGMNCVSGQCVPAPELSDYLAMTLVVSSLGAIFYIRRRSLAAA